MAEGASVPALGLSNKATYSGHTTDHAQKKDKYSDSYFTPQHLTG